MKRILIVDDEPKILQAFSDAFIFEKDYEVVCASDGFEALKIFQKDSFSLMILDWRLKGTAQGKDVLLYSKKFRPSLAVMVFTASIHSVKEIEDLGADACILKPCEDIKERIISFLKERERSSTLDHSL